MEASPILSGTLVEISRRYDIPAATLRAALRSKYTELRRMPDSLALDGHHVAHILASFPTETARPLEEYSTPALLKQYADILAELRARGVIRTANAPVGDYAEYLAQRVYGGTLENNSVKSHDLLSATSQRIQVKARAVGKANKRTTKFSTFRSFQFDLACLLLFDARTYDLIWARELSPDVVRSLARHSDHVNGDHLTRTVVEREGKDVTLKFKKVLNFTESERFGSDHGDVPGLPKTEAAFNSKA